MSACQLCDAVGHSARECGRRHHHITCQICSTDGHSAKECPQLRDASASSSDSLSSSQEDACRICDADAGEACAENCPKRLDREPNLKRRRRLARAAAILASAASSLPTGSSHSKDDKPKEDAKAPPDDDEMPKTAKDVMELSATKLAELPLRAVILLPQVWRRWVWSQKTGDLRQDAHLRLIRGYRDLVINVPASSRMSAWSAADTHYFDEELKIVEDLLDPRQPMTALGHCNRIDAAMEALGPAMLAFREAKSTPWPVVRKAQDIYKGQLRGDKRWAEALLRAPRELASASASAVPKGSAGSPRFRRFRARSTRPVAFATKSGGSSASKPSG